MQEVVESSVKSKAFPIRSWKENCNSACSIGYFPTNQHDTSWNLWEKGGSNSAYQRPEIFTLVNEETLYTYFWVEIAEEGTLAKGCWLTGPRCWLCRSCGGKHMTAHSTGVDINTGLEGYLSLTAKNTPSRRSLFVSTKSVSDLKARMIMYKVNMPFVRFQIENRHGVGRWRSD